MKCSFGVASCARMSSARMPPATKKSKEVAMYRIPMRLWSVVVTQEATRPCVHGARAGADSTLTATGALLRDARGQVVEEGVQLRLRPAAPDRRHGRATLLEQGGDPRSLSDERVAGQRRPDSALALHAVAFGARALEGLAAEAGGDGVARPLLEPGLEPGRRQHLDLGCHRRVEQPAELGAAALVGPRVRVE